jgi:hypothetical protein
MVYSLSNSLRYQNVIICLHVQYCKEQEAP